MLDVLKGAIKLLQFFFTLTLRRIMFTKKAIVNIKYKWKILFIFCGILIKPELYNTKVKGKMSQEIQLDYTLKSESNQITVVAFQSVQLAQASFLQKKQTLQNVFLISVTLRWHRASLACKNQSF